MIDLIGFSSIFLVSLLTFFLGLLRPSISKILITGLLVRILFMLLGNYLITLPDSTADAQTFRINAWKIAQSGFLSVLTQFNGPGPEFITWLIAIFYSLFGKSIIMAQSLSLFFGIGSIFLGWILANKIWNSNIANKVAWFIALFPSLILYSILALREIYIVFFLLVALYGLVSWFKINNIKSIIILMIGFVGATFFHGAMFVGALVFLFIISFLIFKKFLKQIIRFKITTKVLAFLSLFLFLLVFYLSNKIHIPYLGTFENSLDIENLIMKTQLSTRGAAEWPEWLKINTKIEIIYKSPIRSMYFVFAPFPWDISKLKHLIGMFDGLLYAYLAYLIFRNRQEIWKDPALKTVLLILIAYIFVFGFGVGNFGTGIRHRSKIVIMFILLAAPLLPKFTFFKKGKID